MPKKGMYETHERLIRNGIELFRQKGYVEIKIPRGLTKITHKLPDFLLIRHNGESLIDPSKIIIKKYVTMLDVVWGEAVHCNFEGFPPKGLVIKGLRETLTRKEIWEYYLFPTYGNTKYILRHSGPVKITVGFYLFHKNGSWRCSPEN